ncbi:MAG: tetratricopeptide repeat protein [Rhizobiales bacterium]|nr:tetratricopeptide repeat protein [Hyphomicrobiales bacterium]
MHNKINVMQSELKDIPTKDKTALKRIKAVELELFELRKRLILVERELNAKHAFIESNAVLQQPLEDAYSDGSAGDIVRTLKRIPNRKQPNVVENVVTFSLSINSSAQGSKSNSKELNTIPPALLPDNLQSNVPVSSDNLLASPLKKLGYLGSQAADIVAFNQAKGYYDDGNYALAERRFNQFIRFYDESALISNAYFWLGESYFKRNDYNRALRGYFRGYYHNKNGAKAPDNLLKLAQMLIQFKNMEDACSAFFTLSRDYAKSHPSLAKQAVDAQQTHECFK